MASTMASQQFSSRNFVVHQHAGLRTLLTTPTDGSTVPRIVGGITLTGNDDSQDCLVFGCCGVVRSEVHQTIYAVASSLEHKNVDSMTKAQNAPRKSISGGYW